MKTSLDEHLARHVLLHNMLDELVADYITSTGKRPSNSTIMELIQWSAEAARILHLPRPPRSQSLSHDG